MLRYEFTNFSDQDFVGRYGGVDYSFAPSETKSFDPDKHHMLIIMSKQLADRELLKSVKTVGRDPKDMETWGKSLDTNGRPFVMTAEMRKELMRKAIGVLVDTPIPFPDRENVEEAGATKANSEDVDQLKDQVQSLTEMVQSLTGAIKEQQVKKEEEIKEIEKAKEPVSPTMGVTREVLTSMAKELNIDNVDQMTKEQLISAVSEKQAKI